MRLVTAGIYLIDNAVMASQGFSLWSETMSFHSIIWRQHAHFGCAQLLQDKHSCTVHDTFYN